MKIRIETDDSVGEPEFVIRCRDLSPEIVDIQKTVLDSLTKSSKLTLLRDGKEFYLSPESILFFETVDGKTYAHTPRHIYETRQKLYELEGVLPSSFVRAGKSVIIGTRYILAVTRNLTGPSTVQFQATYKQISVSRGYFKQLRDKLNERNSL
jgi:DNA-binding LytR/AlgR family response regulator